MVYDITTDSLTKRFGNIVAVDNLEIKVERNTIYGLVGPDGAGKTTTMRMLCSLMDPDEGTALIGGKDIISDSEDLKGDIGYMPQSFSLYEDLTVLENLQFYAEIYGLTKKIKNEKIKEQLEFSDLTVHSYKLAGQLSGGMKQKLALACNLIHTPKYLFLDEPTIGVDPVARRDLWKILFDLKSQGVTIFVSTPYMDEAERCDEIGLMHEGSIIKNDTPSNIIEAFNKPLYNVITENNYKAKDLALELSSIEDAYLVGEFLHIIFDNYELGSKEFKDYLNKEDIDIESMEKTTPSLEDVFVNIVKTHDKDKGGG